MADLLWLMRFLAFTAVWIALAVGVMALVGYVPV